MIQRLLLLTGILSGQLLSIPDREKFNWQEFQDRSVVLKDSIRYDLLQGNWICYQGSHIGEHKIGWKTKDKPKSLEIKGDKYRNTLSGDFYPFLIDKNLIVFLDEYNRMDSACINLITDKELTISYKRGIDFEQYQYKK